MQWSDSLFLHFWLSAINERAVLLNFTARPACRFLLSPPLLGERGDCSTAQTMQWKAASMLRGCHGPLNTQTHDELVAEIEYDPGNLFGEVGKG